MSEGNGKVSGCGSEGPSGLNLMRFKVYKVTFVFLHILNLFFLDALCGGILKDIQFGQAGKFASFSRECEEGVWGVFINHTA